MSSSGPNPWNPPGKFQVGAVTYLGGAAPRTPQGGSGRGTQIGAVTYLGGSAPRTQQRGAVGGTQIGDVTYLGGEGVKYDPYYTATPPSTTLARTGTASSQAYNSYNAPGGISITDQPANYGRGRGPMPPYYLPPFAPGGSFVSFEEQGGNGPAPPYYLPPFAPGGSFIGFEEQGDNSGVVPPYDISAMPAY